MIIPKERCFGGGATRLLDVTPRWKDIKVKDCGSNFGFCNNCHPNIESFMEQHQIQEIEFLTQLDVALRGPSWISLQVQEIKDKLFEIYQKKYAPLFEGYMTIREAGALRQGNILRNALEYMKEK